MPWVRARTDGGARLDVRVIPRASRTEVAGERDGALLIRLAAPPVEGAANEALIAFLARRLDVPRRNITLVRGAAARAKTLDVAGVSDAMVRQRLAETS